ncbi:phage minor head protein [Lysinibacillus capsici]|uniref:phage minor head protein n=1 Tax=Lysinibacillus capsici TaxID=2115968 RepID=UPI002A7EAF31|nr:phage minor head protein [Lysinibacillus capsici]
MLEMHKKFGKNGQATWTDVNKYNRFNQEMKLIAQQLNADYKEIIKLIQASQERLYIERYLLMAYLLQQSTGEEMGFKIPSAEVIQAALTNPVEFLTFPKIFEAHRNDIIRRLNIEIAQSLQAGESYTDMAIRIEKAMGWTRKKTIIVARMRSQVDLAIEEQASKTARLTKVWMSSLDTMVRKSHRKLDGQKADKDGYYHYGKWKSKAPRLWGVATMDIHGEWQVTGIQARQRLHG